MSSFYATFVTYCLCSLYKHDLTQNTRAANDSSPNGNDSRRAGSFSLHSTLVQATRLRAAICVHLAVVKVIHHDGKLARNAPNNVCKLEWERRLEVYNVIFVMFIII